RALLVEAGAGQCDLACRLILAGHLHPHSKPVTDSYRRREAQVLAYVYRSRSRQACSQHGRDQCPTIHALRDALEVGGRREIRIAAPGIDATRLQREELDIFVGERAFEKGAVADGDFVEGAVAQDTPFG